MEAKEIIEKMRKEDRLLKESAVMKSVQKALIEMGYEPFEEKVMGVYTAIENTPTASNWIPCSERLPEEYGEYLCCDIYGNYILGYPTDSESSETGYFVDSGAEYCNDIIAWQPLSEPYKQEDE